MAKSVIDVEQGYPRTGLGIPVETKNPVYRTNTPPAEPPLRLETSNDFEQIGQPSPPETQDRRCTLPKRILLALVVTISTPIELSRLHHKCDE